MRESFLHFLWRWRRFDARDLATTEGLPIDISHPGEWNIHAGPDFFNARLRIGDTRWAGNVEMHLRASEWLAHGHSGDPAYDNVVLHVVWEEDTPILRAGGERIPCLTLKDRTPSGLLEAYQRLEQERSWVPCQPSIGKAPEIVRLNWLDRLAVERLEQKNAAIEEALRATGNHWEEAFYRSLARTFGLKVNAEPFEALARSLPLLTLARHKNDPAQLEALLFGQAGLLDEPCEEEYPQMLAREYRFLKHKYGLASLPASQWKFLRLRPANFPTIRLAQFAALVHRSAHLLSCVLDARNIRELEHLFSATPGEYWNTHYRFGHPSARREKVPGRDFIRLLIINTVVPFLFHYGKVKSQEQYQKRALALLEELPAERNSMIDNWQAMGIKARNAAHSQALIQLKTMYCTPRRCLECAIGTALLKQENS